MGCLAYGRAIGLTWERVLALGTYRGGRVASPGPPPARRVRSIQIEEFLVTVLTPKANCRLHCNDRVMLLVLVQLICIFNSSVHFRKRNCCGISEGNVDPSQCSVLSFWPLKAFDKFVHPCFESRVLVSKIRSAFIVLSFQEIRPFLA